MKNWQACLTALCLATVGVSASAHDMHGSQSLYSSYPLAVNQAVNSHARGVVHARYNPWRPQPQQNNHQQQSFHAHTAGEPLQIQVAPSVVQRVYPLNPLHQRQGEYRNYVHHYNTPAGFGTGIPWWSDPVAVPYGPWAIGNGWPGGIW